MAESTDKKTRKIAEKRVEPGKEFESYQEAQNQLLAIQAEQQQNLALQANDAMNVQQQNQTLAQAAEVMAMDDLNPATQGILAGYGLNQPRVIKQSNTQRQGPNNITINNTTINNASGPVQGREISIRPQEAGQSKFKAWLTNVFARQDAQWQKQNQEYARRESGLTRNANKMMRKLEGLGKEIGGVLDPRKQAQRAQNSTMNLLKALGLVYFAKKLPDILGFFDNAEEKIKGWFGSIGDKIKDTLKISFEEIGDKLWNDRETGYLNLAFNKFSDILTNRAEYAERVTKGISGWDVLTSPEKIFEWLRLFLGGEKIGVRIEKGNVRQELYEDDDVVPDTSISWRRETLGFARRKGKDLSLNSKSMYGLSWAYKNIKEIKNKKPASSEDYREWLESNKKGNSDESAQEYLKEREFIYTGEAFVLMKYVYDSQTKILDNDLDFINGRLRTDNIYGSIAASHDLLIEIRGGFRSQVKKMTSYLFKDRKYSHNLVENAKLKSARMDYVIYYLDLLYRRASHGGSVIFEDAFDMITTPELRKKLLDSGDAKKVTVILIKKSLDESDKRKYWPAGTTTGLSNFYKKLVRTDHNDVNINDALVLDQEDFNDRIFEKKWTFYSVSSAGFGEILEKITGSRLDDIFSVKSQKKAAEYLGVNLLKWGSLHYGTRAYDNYERAIDARNDAEDERERYKKEKEEEKLGKVKFNATDQTIKILPKGKTDKKDLQDETVSKEKIEQNMNKVYDFFKGNGFSDEQIAGIMGVLGVESGHTFDPRAVNGAEVKEYGIGSAGEGIAQWSNPDRKKPFRDWWKKQHPGEEWEGIRNTTLQDQLDYLMYEWQNEHKPSYDLIRDLDKDKNLSNEEIVNRTTDYFLRGFEFGGNSGLADPSNWDKDSRLKPYDEAFDINLNESRGIYNSFIKKGKEEKEDSSKSDTDTNPTKEDEEEEIPEYIKKALRLGGVKISDNSQDTSIDTPLEPGGTIPMVEPLLSPRDIAQSLAMAENITPAERENRSPENNNEILLARCADGIDYIAKSMAPLSEVINSGNIMVSETISKSGGLTNLTPREPQLEMNQV